MCVCVRHADAVVCAGHCVLDSPAHPNRTAQTSPQNQVRVITKQLMCDPGTSKPAIRDMHFMILRFMHHLNAE